MKITSILLVFLLAHAIFGQSVGPQIACPENTLVVVSLRASERAWQSPHQRETISHEDTYSDMLYVFVNTNRITVYSVNVF